MSAIISIAVKRQCVKLANEGKTATEIYRDYYCKQTDSNHIKNRSFARQLTRWRKKAFADDETLEAGNLGYKFRTYATTVQLDSENKLVQSWIKSSNKDDVYLELIEAIKKIPAIEIESLKSIPVKKLLEVPLFDMHFGPSTFLHYEGHLNEIKGHIRKKYEHILIPFGSDMLHHNDMQNKTASGTPIEHLDIRKAWDDALKFYISLITEAVQNASKVTVYYIKGNHDESLSWAFAQLLKQLFPTVEFDDSFQERKVFTWEGIFIGYIHGDKPIKDIDRVFVKENRKAYGDAKIVEIHVGHTHKENAKGNTQDVTGTMVRVLSTANMTDQWHDDNNYVGSNKRFQLFEYGPDKLIAIYYV